MSLHSSAHHISPRLTLDILSTPPPLLNPSAFDSPSTSSDPSSRQGYQSVDLSGGRGGSLGAKGDNWAARPNNSSSPPSPSTIDSYTDSQGGECFPPGSDSSEILEAFNRARALSQPSVFRRNNLSLSINNLPSFPSENDFSPSTLASSGAPFTDSLNFNCSNPYEYFQFEQQPPTSAEEPTESATLPIVPPSAGGNLQYGYRLPASQPSSPVRTIFPPGQAPFNAQAGRQRGATFSGTYSYAEQFGGPLIPTTTAASSLLPSAIPTHLAFTQIQAAPLTDSPLLASPVIHTSTAVQTSYFDTTIRPQASAPVPNSQALQALQNGLVDDLATPTQGLPGVVLPTLPPTPLQSGTISRRSSFSASGAQALSADVLRTGEDLEKLKLVEDIMNSANQARAAILRGEDAAFSANVGQLNHLNHQLVTVNDMAATSASVTSSPVTYQASPNQQPVMSRPGTAMSNSMLSAHALQMQSMATPMQMQAAPMQPMPVQMQPAYISQQMMPIPVQPQQMPTQQMSMQLPVQHQVLSHPMPMQAMPMQAMASAPHPQMQPQPMQMMQPQPMQLRMPQEQSIQQLPMINTSLPPPNYGTKAEPVSAGYPTETTSLAAPPPLIHSHSFPNGHQLPSQLHGLAAPTTPVVPSPSFAAALGIGHPPHISSPLATMPMSRPPSPRSYAQPDQSWLEPIQNGESSMVRAVSDTVPLLAPMPRRPSLQDRAVSDSRADGRPIANRGRSTSTSRPNRNLTGMTSSVPPSAWQSRAASPDDEDDDESEDDTPRKMKRRRSSAGNAVTNGTGSAANNALISEDMRRQLDRIFEEFLNVVCSDLEMTDAKGEKLHQVLMPKKMQRMDESADYRPFKFRIQAFTNSFSDELVRRGLTEETLSAKKIKTFLWNQPLISRFNSDGKKAKSKGNHIWNVEAKRMPEGSSPKWLFRPFKREISSHPSSFAQLHQRYEYEPRVWDPQAAAETLHPSFSSPQGTLPDWLHWEESKLVGVPTQLQDTVDIIVVASFTDIDGQTQSLSQTFKLSVVLPTLLPPQPEVYDISYAQPTFAWPADYTEVPQHFLQQPLVPIDQAMPLFTGQQQALPPMQQQQQQLQQQQQPMQPQAMPIFVGPDGNYMPSQ